MSYDNLYELINESSSSRRYFLSLSAEVQETLRAHSETIHTADQLHRAAGAAETHAHHCHVSDSLDDPRQ